MIHTLEAFLVNILICYFFNLQDLADYLGKSDKLKIGEKGII